MNITRRNVLQGIAAGSALPTLPHAANLNTKSRPNILFIMVDQLHHKAISALGNSNVNTPNIDRLIRSGTSFETCQCAAPVCIPCRGSLLSGRMPSETGIWINTAHQKSQGKLPRDIPNIGQWLQAQANYETIYAGKYHLPHAHTYSIPGFEVIASGLEHRGDPGDSGVARACEAWLYNHQSDRPFMMVCSLVNPHDVCHWLSINTDHSPDHLERYPLLEDIAELPELPPNFSVDKSGESNRHHEIRTKQQPTSGGWQQNDWRYYLWAYYRQVEMVDAEIGHILDALETTGLDKNTLVVFTSDHGEGCGEHQMVRKGFLYDSAIRVPLVFSFPGKIAEGKTNKDGLTGSLDLMPTFCEFAGVPSPPELNHAQSLYPMLTGQPGARLRDCVVTENNDPARDKPDATAAGRALRTKKYKYITYFDQTVEQLFDMENDPGETINLAGKSQYSSILQEHRNKLKDWASALIPSSLLPPNPWIA